MHRGLFSASIWSAEKSYMYIFTTCCFLPIISWRYIHVWSSCSLWWLYCFYVFVIQGGQGSKGPFIPHVLVFLVARRHNLQNLFQLLSPPLKSLRRSSRMSVWRCKQDYSVCLCLLGSCLGLWGYLVPLGLIRVMKSSKSRHSCLHWNPLANPKHLAALRSDGTVHPEEQVSSWSHNNPQCFLWCLIRRPTAVVTKIKSFWCK